MKKHEVYKKRKVKKQSKIGAAWQRKKPWQRAAIITAIVMIILSILAFSGYQIFKSIMNDIDRDDEFNKLKKDDLGFESVIDENVYNIALFGIDTRDVNGTQSNSDSIMILSINKNDNKIRLVSIMRDSFVPTERNGQKIYAKINAAYSYGGPANAVKTINQCFGLDISEYATVNFFGMADIIDAVGGIYCNVMYDEIHCKININTHIQNQCSCMGVDPKKYYVKNPGKILLNGVQAVAYARIRYAKNWLGTNNDFGRTERQRYVMQQLFEKASDMSIASYPSLVKKLAPFVKTSLSNEQLLNLASLLSDKPEMITSRVPSDEYIINADFRPYGGSTVYYNYEFAGKVLRAFFYDGILPEDYIAKNGVDKTDWFGSGSSSGKTYKKSTKTNNDDDDGYIVAEEKPTSQKAETVSEEAPIVSEESQITSEEPIIVSTPTESEAPIEETTSEPPAESTGTEE